MRSTYLSHCLLFPWLCINMNLEVQVELYLNPHTLIWDAGIPSGFTKLLSQLSFRPFSLKCFSTIIMDSNDVTARINQNTFKKPSISTQMVHFLYAHGMLRFTKFKFKVFYSGIYPMCAMPCDSVKIIQRLLVSPKQYGRQS